MTAPSSIQIPQQQPQSQQTTPTQSQPAQQAPVSKEAAAAVRKRRRRAPAGGATDDCFTCSKRNVKCDRRRPYCSQCLEIGNDCSGYKTQLTWGVGVASRGKLRGLSLPIAKAPPVAGSVKKASISRARTNSTATTTSIWSDTDEASRRLDRGSVDLSPEHIVGSAPTTPYPHGYDMLSMSHPENTPPLPASHWGSLSYSSSVPNEGPGYRKLGAHLGPLAIPESLSSGLSDVDYMSPMSHSYPRDDIPFLHSPNVMYDNYSSHGSPIPQSPGSGILMDQRAAPTSCPGLVYAASEQSSSLTSHMDNFEAQMSQKLMRDCDGLNVPEMDGYGTSCTSTGSIWPSPPPEEMSPRQTEPTSAHWPTVMEPQPIHVSSELIAKMPFFMDYYKNTMCQSMVFIDGPSNPYRDHILQLAQASQSLQHAICALSACNLRMKRRLSLGQDTRELSEKLMAEKSAADGMTDAQPEDQSLSEEYQHRNLAVHLLNQQLNDPVKSSHDSVLATILLLCHYRMVESGIAKFHTQFAGVKKILAIRRRSQQYAPSRDSAWMEAIFTYFDAISASINDREAQLTGFFGVAPDAPLLPPGAENLVGCDRELFKTISKLGRLNLLSQHRPVQNTSSSTLPRNVPSRSQSPLGSPLGHAYKGSIGNLHQQQLGDMYGLGGGHRFDGNGFGTTLDDEELLNSAVCSSASYDEQRNTFWCEWKEARLALQSWEFDASRIQASLPSPATPSQIRDLGSLSEAFRYAALLYTERLASPNVPSNHSNFQNLVSQVVYYATSLEAGSSAEKFLLWPLFVAGSECVNELQQNIVRSKCRDIMTRSGYMNNLAALDVLERLWAGDWKEGLEARSPGAARVEAMRRGPFNWTRCIGGPGVEVEWIMF
ncbi:hypothetical protein HYQ45_014217 [Verticillium longisporum]|uniref:Zn(2)-C6 fungal-type domain-containing protein n=2 Tax=Verticillium longisporum TaxID=100787 RepID=A0A8I2ZCY0_VERLO|nr:hypothetical protein HYQ45_014217 [Verticillium longisporum]